MKKFIVKEMDANDDIVEVDIIQFLKNEYEQYPQLKATNKNDLRTTLMHEFWSRTQHEWLIHPWVSPCSNKKFVKVDVWEWAIEPNLDLIYDICVEEGII